jgi:hypothetical protein
LKAGRSRTNASRTSGVLAIVLLGEQHELDHWFYLGVAVILGAVFIHPLLHRQRRLTQQPELMGTSESHSMVD